MQYVCSRRATLKFVLQSALGLTKPYKFGLLDEDSLHFILTLSLMDVGLGFFKYTPAHLIQAWYKYNMGVTLIMDIRWNFIPS